VIGPFLLPVMCHSFDATLYALLCVSLRGLLLERVRGLVASKERLVYALSHELRSPINGMLGERHSSTHRQQFRPASAQNGQHVRARSVHVPTDCL
jgi:signal transduction histidine kinase